MDYRRKYHAVFANALALLDNLYHNKKRDPESQMDGSLFSRADGCRYCGMLRIRQYRAAVCLIKLEDLKLLSQPLLRFPALTAAMNCLVSRRPRRQHLLPSSATGGGRKCSPARGFGVDVGYSRLLHLSAVLSDFPLF